MRIFTVLVLLFTSTGVLAGEIHAAISGFESSEGQLVAVVFSDARQEGFPTEMKQAVLIQHAKIIDGKSHISLKDLESGTYAIFVFHDKNANGIVDHKWYGPPAESFAYYRDYQVFMGPPDFDEVSFQMGNTKLEIEISLQHF